MVLLPIANLVRSLNPSSGSDIIHRRLIELRQSDYSHRWELAKALRGLEIANALRYTPVVFRQHKRF
jgi:hypothetical protein